ncbi:hypothetical protein LKD81_15035 [Lachnospiraceae bacterium CLA-AA-H215]|uniref:Uncharacterized protein n=1 Tax=Hominifimenecus microfluidus TaxID=2885348 RepID=A0AAE3ECM6_9FIRM|nr:hypothetical protein [Hominifimenecus microfluidus]
MRQRKRNREEIQEYYYNNEIKQEEGHEAMALFKLIEKNHEISYNFGMSHEKMSVSVLKNI